MKYNIITLNSFGEDEERGSYKKAITDTIGCDQFWMPAFNAHMFDPLEGLAERGLELKTEWNNAKRGELGVWLSNYDRWKAVSEMDEPLVVFEDDAILSDGFNTKLSLIMEELPDDWDFVALWVPGNQLQDYLYDVDYDDAGNPRVSGYVKESESVYLIPGNEWTGLVYQGYGMVSLVYSPKGGQRLVELAHERGVDGPVDCWVYQEAHKGNLKGFAPYPWMTPVVDYDWAAQSHVQQTERAL